VTFRERFASVVAAGQIASDPAQAKAAQHFADLEQKLAAASVKASWVNRLFRRNQTTMPGGLYLYGEVGRGKSMLMDMFFAEAQGIPKRRAHFHAFMQDIHARRTVLKVDHVMEHIADEIASESRLLCLDEMQIADIADAMIMGRLFEALQARDVCFVTTSNVPPEQLYRDGLNRQLFLPFIARLRADLDVVALDSPVDYRLGRIRTKETYLHPLSAQNRVAFNTLWRDLTDNAPGHDETLVVLDRKLLVPKAAHGCAAFTFQELCVSHLGPADYLAIARAYRTVFISGVPKLTAAQRNETKRFILMIDTFYDAHVHVVFLAEAPPEELARAGQHSTEFRRTVSRLKEMQSGSWWA
jgi:cell division protein ZapE